MVIKQKLEQNSRQFKKLKLTLFVYYNKNCKFASIKPSKQPI